MSLNIIPIIISESGTLRTYEVPTRHINGVDDAVADVKYDLSEEADQLVVKEVGYSIEVGRVEFRFTFWADLSAEQIEAAASKLHRVFEPSVRKHFRIPPDMVFETQM